MTNEERSIMQQHIEYWQQYMDQGIMLVLGPVLDPKGPYGLGIVAVDDEDQVKELIANDPASRINQYEFYPMMAAVSKNLAQQ